MNPFMEARGFYAYTEWLVTTDWGDKQTSEAFGTHEDANKRFVQEQIKHRQQNYRPLPTMRLQVETCTTVTLREVDLGRES